MILHQLRVTHWRSLLNPAEVGPFADGLNVIHAPNGTGKSSLFEAMRRALFDAHNVTGRDIEGVRPWGRSLTPQVTIEFSQGGIRYRVEKTFLDGPNARLLRLEDDQFVPLADGRNADSKLREILGANEAPGRGLSKPEHWGLSQALWAPQGALGLGTLSSDVSENLRQALGVQVSGEGGSRLEELLDEHYLALFTRSGKPRSGKDAAPVVGLETAATEAAQERQTCMEQHRRFEEAARAVEDARLRRAQAKREADAIRGPLADAHQLAESYQRLQNELEQRRLTEQNSKDRADSLRQSIDLMGTAKKEVAQLQSQIQREETHLAGLATELNAARSLAKEQKAKRDEARNRRTTLTDLTAGLEDARGFISDAATRQTVATRLSKLQELQSQLKTERESRLACVAPDDKTIRAVRKQIRARDTADTTLQASLIQLTVRPLNSATVTRTPSKETRSIPAGQDTTFTGSPEVGLSIEGFGTIHAAGPEVDVEALRSEVATSENKLAELTRPYGTQDPDRLQALREKAGAIDQKIETLRNQIEALLGEETADGLKTELAELEARITERTGRFPAWKDVLPVVSDLQSALDQRRKAIESAVEQAEDDFDKAESTAQAVEKRHTNTEAALRNARANLEAANGRLTELTKDGLSDEARQAARDDALRSWEAACSLARQCQKRLTDIGDDPRSSVEMLERQHKAQEEAEAAAREEENKAEWNLQALAAEGAYSKLVACEEKLADLNIRLQREKRRMDALRLLHDTVAECKAAAVAAVAAPVELVATRMLARVAGPRLGNIRLTDHFVPNGIQPEALDDSVELENLSGGEQEQLFLVTRLALGHVLAKEERQLVVLDDVLNATDTGRLARLLVLLEEASERLQIVILTCHPERYRALAAAHFLQLTPTSS